MDGLVGMSIPNGGSLVRDRITLAKLLQEDPRGDALLAIGYLLQNGIEDISTEARDLYLWSETDEHIVGGRMFALSVDSGDGEIICVFRATISPAGVVYHEYECGAWEVDLTTHYRTARMTLRKRLKAGT